MSIWNNDEARRFFIANGYPSQYNDGLKAYLEDILGLTGEGKALNDLLKNYISLYGTEFLVYIDNLLLENGFDLLQENNSMILLESSAL
jgi:hypothetical protein